MRKDVFGGPARQIKLHPMRQEAEAGGRKLDAMLARQHAVELVLDRVEMKHVGSSVGYLSIAEVFRAPVAELLLLRQIDAEQFSRQVFQAVLVGVGAGQPRGYFGAVHRLGHDPEGLIKNAEIES